MRFSPQLLRHSTLVLVALKHIPRMRRVDQTIAQSPFERPRRGLKRHNFSPGWPSEAQALQSPVRHELNRRPPRDFEVASP
jgi:hypothetical protein